jgi:hypothetical protein
VVVQSDFGRTASGKKIETRVAKLLKNRGPQSFLASNVWKGVEFQNFTPSIAGYMPVLS